MLVLLPRTFQRKSPFSPLQCAWFTSPPGSKVALIARLRKEFEGAPVTLSKKAIDLNEGNYENARAWLREQLTLQGIKTAEKVQNRAAKDGYIGVAQTPQGAAIVEVRPHRSEHGLLIKLLIAFKVYLEGGGDSIPLSNPDPRFAKYRYFSFAF
jgi:hypothetical protein